MLFERFALESRGQRIDVICLEMETERVASGDEPAHDRVGQMQMAALAVEQYSVVVVLAFGRFLVRRPIEAEPIIKGLGCFEIIAGQDGDQCVSGWHSGTPGIFHIVTERAVARYTRLDGRAG